MIDPLSPPTFISQTYTLQNQSSRKEEEFVHEDRLKRFPTSRQENTIENSNKLERKTYNLLLHPLKLTYFEAIKKYDSSRIAEELIKNNIKQAYEKNKEAHASYSNNFGSMGPDDLLQQTKGTHFSSEVIQPKDKQNIETQGVYATFQADNQNKNSLSQKQSSQNGSSKYLDILKKQSLLQKDALQQQQSSSISRRSSKTLDTKGRGSYKAEPNNKYQEIVEKYLERDVTPNKIEKSQTTRRSSSHSYQDLFEPKEEDDTKVDVIIQISISQISKAKSMKMLKQEIEAKLLRDDSLKTTYLAREIYFTSDFITNLSKQLNISKNIKLYYLCKEFYPRKINSIQEKR